MLNSKEIVAKATELMKEGKTMEEALQAALADALKGAPKLQGDRLETMSNLRDIQELRKAIKSSNGMKSKMNKNTQAVERYTAQIKAGQSQLKALMDEINSAEDPFAKAIELNADATDLLNMWLKKKNSEVDAMFKARKEEKKLSNDDAKSIRNMMSSETPEAIAKELKAISEAVYEAYQDRLKRNDQWIATINKTYRFCGIEG
jgi:hypothetical protein